MTTDDLYQFLREQDHVNPNQFIDVVRKLTNGIERETVNFSQRFQMVMLPWRSTSVWFACVDDTPFVFALSEKIFNDELSVKSKGKCETIPCISIPPCGYAWTTLQQKLVDRFKADDHVRAVLAACMLSFNFCGRFTCALSALCPTSLRRFTAAIEYDVPIDLDILTCLANPYLTDDDKLFFDCDGACAAVERLHDDGIYHLEAISPPVNRKPFEEASRRLMPYLYGLGERISSPDDDYTQTTENNYGFGERINGSDDDYTRTREIDKLMNRLRDIRKNDGYVYKILKMVSLKSPRMNLDLTEAANMISKWEGGILPGFSGRKPWETEREGLRGAMHRAKRFVRRITGDVIVIGKDGLYKSSRFDGTEVEGGIEFDLAIFKVGYKAKREIWDVDRKITNLSEVAAYILGKEYVPLDRCDGDMTMVPDMDDMWNDEIALANTLAALICRRYGMFEGFSSFASSPKYLGPLYRDSLAPHMEADIYLPVLHVFVDPPRQLRMMRYGFMLLLLLFSMCTLTALLLHYPVLAVMCLVAYATTLFFAAWNSEELEDRFYRACLQRLSPCLRPRVRHVGNSDRKYDLLIHNNPFVLAEQDGRVRVFGHHCSYNFENCYPKFVKGNEGLILFCSFFIFIIFFK